MKPERQPPALYLLVALEAWERFSYYGLRVLLFSFLMRELALEAKDASAVARTMYLAIAIAPIAGGYLADRFLGHRKAALVGAVLLSLGAFALAAKLPVTAALALLAAGSAFFRPSVPAMLGHLYRRGDARRDAAFTWFYAAINAGSLLAGLAFDALGSAVGQQAGIALAGLSFGIIAAVFATQQRLLRAEGYPAGETEAPRARLGGRDAGQIAIWVLGAGCAAVGAAYAWSTLPIPADFPVAVPIGAIAALVAALFAAEAARARRLGTPLGAAAWQRLGLLGLVAALSAIGWAAANSASDRVTRLVLDQRISSGSVEWFFSLNPLVVLIAAPAVALLWRGTDAPPRKISGLVKIGAGLLLVAIGAGVTALAGEDLVTAVLGYGIIALGEIAFAAIGYSLVTQLAPARSVGLAFAAWTAIPVATSLLSRPAARGIADEASSAGGALAIAAAVAGAALIALTPLLKRWMHGAEDPEPARAAGAPYRSGGAPDAEGAPPSAETVAQDDGRPARQMVFGALWAVGGTVVTLASYGAASGGGQYVVAYGAILYGVITFFRGLAGYSGSSKS